MLLAILYTLLALVTVGTATTTVLARRGQVAGVALGLNGLSLALIALSRDARSGRLCLVAAVWGGLALSIVIVSGISWRAAARSGDEADGEDAVAEEPVWAAAAVGLCSFVGLIALLLGDAAGSIGGLGQSPPPTAPLGAYALAVTLVRQYAQELLGVGLALLTVLVAMRLHEER